MSTEKWNSYRDPHHTSIGILYLTIGIIFEVTKLVMTYINSLDSLYPIYNCDHETRVSSIFLLQIHVVFGVY